MSEEFDGNLNAETHMGNTQIFIEKYENDM